METKQTPGPWAVDDEYRWRDRVSSGWKKHAQVRAENPATKCITNIARCASNAMDVDNEANARLIAAAPELLEALRTLRDVAFMGLDSVVGDDAIAAADAAISKAIGA